MVYFRVSDGTRLGNWLFQYAAALSQHDEVTAYVTKPELEKRLRACPIFEGLRITTERPKDPEEVIERGGPHYVPIVRHDFSRPLLLNGFFQSAKYFDEAVVRGALAVPAERESYLRAKYAEALSASEVTGISVRRGDYLRLPYYHPFVGKRFLWQAIERFPNCQVFVVCSDDIPWCKKFFPQAFPDKVFVFVEGESVVDQLYIHALCRNNIVSNSSFSWWGAWLNPNPSKRVIAPSQWFGRGYERKGLDWRDLYFKEMEILPNPYTFCGLLRANVYRAWDAFKGWTYPLRSWLK